MTTLREHYLNRVKVQRVKLRSLELLYRYDDRVGDKHQLNPLDGRFEEELRRAAKKLVHLADDVRDKHADMREDP